MERAALGDAAAGLAAFENSPSMIVVVEGDELRVTAANAAWRGGFAAPNPVGSPLRETFPEAERQRAFEFFERVIETGEPLEHREFRFETGFGTPDAVEVYFDFAMVPLLDDSGNALGVVCEIRDATDQVRARQAAEERAARAEQKYAEAVDAVRTLQDAMLPRGVPILPRVETAARYLLAESETAAGGDWFDALPLADGRLALMVGDVVGHGVPASAAMGRLRAALRAALSVYDDPGVALRTLDRYAETDDEAFATTVVVAVLDPVTGTMEYCTAGHPPPLVVPATGEPGYLPASGAASLGAGSTFPTARASLAPGDLVVLYSDGIVQRHGRTMEQNRADLLTVVTDVKRRRPWRIGTPGSDVENVCQTSLELLVRETGYHDDVTLIATQLLAEEPQRMQLVVPAGPGVPAGVRQALGEWLDRLGVQGLDYLAVQHAVGELVTNAVEHAYEDPSDGVVEIAGILTADGRIELSVRDYGRWSPAEPAADDGTGDGADSEAGRGRGLAMARGMVDALTIERGASGTTGHVRHRVERPVSLLRAPGHVMLLKAAQEVLEVQVDGRGNVVVRGPIDSGNAQILRIRLLETSRGGAEHVVVDLSEVTHLGSAGVQVLVEFSLTSDIRLRTGAGSVADHVLTVAQVEHDQDAG